MIGFEIQTGGELIAGGGERARGFFAGRFQAHDQVFAAPAQLLDHVVADLTQRQRDLLALLGQRMGDALGRLVDLLADEIADGREILRQVDMDIVDGGAHLLGLPDQRVALIGQILKEPANANLIVAVSSLERRDLVAHQRFKLARARQRALDAVAHGRDLAADRLSDGDDRIARHPLRLGEPHRDLRHRLRNEPQFLGAPGHVGDAEEENDRQQRRGAEPDQDRQRRVVGAERGIDVAEIGDGEGKAADDPDRRQNRGDK